MSGAGASELYCPCSGSGTLPATSGVLRGRIDTTKLQTCGHSKGGGGALWASDTLGS